MWMSKGSSFQAEATASAPQLAFTPSGLDCHARSLCFPEVGLAQSHTMTELDLGFLPPHVRVSVVMSVPCQHMFSLRTSVPT